MEIVDIVQEYAQTQEPKTTETQPESSLTNETTSTEVSSAAPPESISNESAFESLLTGKPNVQQEEVAPSATEEVFQQDVIQMTAVDVEDASGMEDVIDEDDFIKSKTEGKFSSWEEVYEAIEQQAQPKFENELSEAVYQMLLEGKTEEIFEILGTRQFAEDVQNMDDEDVLKAYIKVSNPDFDDQDVEDEFNESYAIDEYQFDESKLKREQKKLSQRIKTDVQDAKEFFESLAQDIKLPDFSRQQVEQAPQEDTEMEAMIQEQRSLYLQSLQGVESRIGTLPFQWKDEKANMSVSGKFDIPAQELSKYRQAAENLEDYQVNRYYKDGQYMSDKMVKELYIADNFEKILNSAISQAVNQTRLEMLKQSKNIQSEQTTSGTFKPNAADDERAMLDQLFMGHLRRQS